MNRHISCGLRINPEYSPVATAFTNPCAPGSCLGITASVLAMFSLTELKDFIVTIFVNPLPMELEKTLKK